MPAPAAEPPPGGGLRARQKAAAMRRIQAVALDLFDTRGYDAVTVEQVAEAADVSPRTVYRWFGSKDGLVVHDEIDPQMLALALHHAATLSPLDAVHATIADLTALLEAEEPTTVHRMRYLLGEPALRTGVLLASEHYAHELATGLARQRGLPDDALETRVIAWSLLGALLSALEAWRAGGFRDDLLTLVATAVDTLGTALTRPPRSA